MLVIDIFASAGCIGRLSRVEPSLWGFSWGSVRPPEAGGWGANRHVKSDAL